MHLPAAGPSRQPTGASLLASFIKAKILPRVHSTLTWYLSNRPEFNLHIPDFQRKLLETSNKNVP